MLIPIHVTLAGVRCGAIMPRIGVVVTDKTGDSYEDTVTIHCRRGYHRVTGSHLRTCGGGGAWSGTALVCAGAGHHTHTHTRTHARTHAHTHTQTHTYTNTCTCMYQ